MKRTFPKGCYLHFTMRVHQRIGADVDAHDLWNRLRQCIEANSDNVQFIARVNRSGRRLWRFTINDRPYFTIYDHKLQCPVTVLQPEGQVVCHGDLKGKPINLQAHI